MIWFAILDVIISCRSIRNVNFVIVHSLWSYMKYFISLIINNLYILHCNDPLVPKWGSMWFNEIGKQRNRVLLLETILVPTQWVSIILIKNFNMPCIYLESCLLPLHGYDTQGAPMCSCQILLPFDMELGMSFVQ